MNRKLLIGIVLSLIGQIVYSQSCTNCGGTTVIGTNASAIGTNTVANGHSTFASGFASQATQPYTTAIGFYSFANYTKAISLGSMVKSNTYRAVVIGSGGEQSTNIFLQNNIPNSLMIGFSSQYPTLFVSESESSVNYDKTGMVGIGNVTDPQAKLHILADEGEPAAIFIEPRNWGEGEYSSLMLGSRESGITASSKIGMDFLSEGNYFFNSGGFVGINTAKPEYNLHVNGATFTTSFRMYDEHLPPKEGYVMVSDDLGNGYWVDPNAYSLWTPNENGTDIYRMDGNVGIGTINTYGYKLAVNGKIIAEELMVKHPDEWPDYVFGEKYKLMGLNELSSYIEENSHLPEIPSAKTVEEEGIEVGEMNALLLKKIEELTLYIIDQQKQIDNMQQKLDNLK